MLMFSCDCLNILIEIENDFGMVTPELLDLTEEEKADSFFKQELFQVKKLLSINKSQSGLVYVRKVGSWTVNKCISCGVQTHAIHKQKGASLVLINSKLLPSSEISNCMSSMLFSPIFKMVIPSDIGTDDEFMDTYPNKEVEKTIKNLNEVVSSFIKKEQADVNDRIRKYTEEQYESMNKLKDRAYKEHSALVRMVKGAMSEIDGTNKNVSIAEVRSPPKSLSLSGTVTSSLETNMASPMKKRHSPKIQKTSGTVKRKDTKKDDDLIFDFESSDGLSSVPSSERGASSDNMDDSEKEIDDEDEEEQDVDNEEGIAIQRPRDSLPSIAKSLPVNIPIFSAPPKSRNRSTNEVVDDSPSAAENVDIAASIKALAKSVHGDAIFGELPRPRFSSQI